MEWLDLWKVALALGALVLVYFAFRSWIRGKEESGAAKERQRTQEANAKVLEEQRDAVTTRPDPAQPDDVLGRL